MYGLRQSGSSSLVLLSLLGEYRPSRVTDVTRTEPVMLPRLGLLDCEGFDMVLLDLTV
jgi:hypothetical protein